MKKVTAKQYYIIISHLLSFMVMVASSQPVFVGGQVGLANVIIAIIGFIVWGYCSYKLYDEVL